jgi:hypothetical protein
VHQPNTARLSQTTFYVATNGSDLNPGTLQQPFRTIQHGLDVATRPGDEVMVRRGTYIEGLTFPANGEAGRPIVLSNYAGEHPFISGAGGSAQKLVRVFNRSHIRVTGFEVGNLVATSPTDSGAIFVEGYGDDIQIVNNDVHDVSPQPHQYANGRAIQVRGFFANRPLTNVVVQGNEIDRCVEQDGNVLEVSGNTDGVRVTHNTLQDDGGNALNVTGGTNPPTYSRWKLQVRNVEVSDNRISATTGHYALGLYIQASLNVRVLRNHVSTSVFGLLVSSEYPGVNSQDITVADNVVTDNSKAGLWIGTPYHKTTVIHATVVGNTVVHNGVGDGENLGIGGAKGVMVTQNQFVAADNIELVFLGKPFIDIALNNNCYDDPGHSPSSAQFNYGGKTHVGFDAYRLATHQDRSSTFGPPCGH